MMEEYDKMPELLLLGGPLHRLAIWLFQTLTGLQDSLWR